MNMARISVADDHLTVRLRGINRIWAMRKGVTVPLSQVRGATVDPGARRELKGRRSPGLHIPGIAAVGTFHRDGEKTLWEVYRGDRAVVIQLSGEPYDRLIVEVKDPRGVVERINRAISQAAR
jgi:hypothetical protein